MRIPIREQLGLLVLVCSLIALGVLAIATWVQNHRFVVDIRLSSLALTASLKAAQLSANLVLFQTSIISISTRILIQNALVRYNLGNNTEENWSRSVTDLKGALSGGGRSALLLQGIIFPKNDTGTGDPNGLVNVTGDGTRHLIPLPIEHPNGSTVYLGDSGPGYPPRLYPNFTFTYDRINDTHNHSNAFSNGQPFYSNSTLFLGPWQVNDTFALVSLTVAINNNTSRSDILGYLTVVMDARMIYDVINSPEGLDETGQALIVTPDTPMNKFPPGFKAFDELDGAKSPDSQRKQKVRYLLPPRRNSTIGIRHPLQGLGAPNPPFELGDYPAVYQAYTKDNNAINNAGSKISTHNEADKEISVGYALTASSVCDWVLIVEQSHGEVVAPINHLRDVLLACVFGTLGLILLVLLPIAHYSVRPIRRLRDATKKTVEPHLPPSDMENSSHSRSLDSGLGDEMGECDEENTSTTARKEGFLETISRWRTGKKESLSERRDANRRHVFRIPSKVQDKKHFIHDELTDLTRTFNEMSEELVMQYERLEERVKERTAELELSKKAAEAANESKTLFIANISHELKTPLNGILGMCAVSMGEDDPAKIKRSLGIIYKSGDLLLHLLTDLLTFSKNQIGQQLSLDEKEFRLADISSQILSIFDNQAREGNIALRVSFQGPSAPVATSPENTGDWIYGPFGTGRVRDMCLWGDQHRILQVLINLVSNSLKFTPPGGSVDVRIKCLGDAPGKGQDATPSRKTSTQSKQSKHSKHSKQSRQHSRASRTKSHGKNESDMSGPASVPSLANSEATQTADTTLTINVMGSSKHLPQVAMRDRSSSPPPLNSKTLLFEFDVEDTGPGIPESQQKKVFEPFVQGDLGLSKKYGGTGLGLSICAQLANLMGGSISLVSKEGVGSTFSMRIPLRFTKERSESATSSHVQLTSRPNSVAGQHNDIARTPQRHGSDSDLSLTSQQSNTGREFNTPAKPRLVGLSQPFFAASSPLQSPKKQLEAIVAAEASKAKKGDRVRVLVAEDNKVNQEVVLRMLKLEDIYDVTVAKDGQEALDKVKKSMEEHNLYNLIFMDVQMPNLDGLQSTRLIREMGFSAPIVALTAFAEESNVKECLDSGMNFFLPKPIRRPQLKQVLKKYCATIPEADEEQLNSSGSNAAADVNNDSKSDHHDDDLVSPMS